MTIVKLFIYIAIFAAAATVAAMALRKTRNVFINFLQFFVGGLFIFSGVIKAIDPVGTAIKMEEYFEVFIEYTPKLEGFWHFWAHHALGVSIFMIVLEIFLGVALLLGKFKRITSWLLLAIIVFFTILTGFSHFTGKVTDCGCFGDFMKLTPYQSFMKDIFLTVLILIIFAGRKKLAEWLEDGWGTIVTAVLTVAATWFTYSNYFDLPVKDFRAYKIGVNISECMELPPDAKPYIYEITYIYKNKSTGQNEEFVNSFPSDFSAYDYVDRKDKLVQKGDDPKCKDFVITDIDGEEMTDALLEEPGKLFVITSFDLNKADRKGLERLKDFSEEAIKAGASVIGITGSSLDVAEAMRHDLGLPVTFYNLDAVPIKTMNRSNPGLMLWEEGTILGKWHHRKVKSYEKVMNSVKD